MTTARFIAVLAIAGIAASAAGAGRAGEPDSASPFRFESGIRYWYSTGTSAKDLYDTTGAVLVSRLTYGGLEAHAAELYFRADHETTGWFAKGHLGAGIGDWGELIDEDFPPFTAPYSRTSSTQNDGDLAYATVDFGYDFLRSSGYGLGGFVGYNYYHEKLAVYGCAQTGAHAGVCVPGISESVAVIGQNNTWHSLRLGLSGRARPVDRLTVTADAAFVYSFLNGRDHHFLRPSINPVPEDGDGPGFQLQLVLAYRVTDRFDIGVGMRYWTLTSDGFAHFEQTADGGDPQVESWSTVRYGAFVQAGFSF